MDFMELINKRSSVRKYSRICIKRVDIDKCLEASRLAPSACNSQPWQFIIIDTPELKDKLSQAMLSGIYGLNVFIKNAPVLVAIVTDKAKFFTKICNFVRDTRLYLIDIGIACEHFVLCAAELGIGTCILGWFNEKAAKKALGVPKEKKIELVISMGYPADGLEPRPKDRKSLSEISLYMRGEELKHRELKKE